MKKFALLLSGCGVYDGSEIHEVVLCMLAIDERGCTYHCFAPNKGQYHVIDHAKGEQSKEKRNMMVESARLSRGQIQNLSEYNPADFDALIIPGGFGVAKNLSTYNQKEAAMEVEEEVEKAIRRTHQAKKPIGALCIAPVLLAKVLGSQIHITIGNDQQTTDHITKMGADHQASVGGEVVIDRENRIFTTPCYMLDKRISQIAKGTDKLIEEILASI